MELIDLFESRRCDEVYVIYSRFVSMARQMPTLVKLLPIEPSDGPGKEGKVQAMEYLFEPSHRELLTDLLPNFVYIQILESFYQTSVSEHAARMAAMENATSNCKEMVRSLDADVQ